jgi:hypothetical protein
LCPTILKAKRIQRLWIIQEIVLAQRQDQVVLHCGSCVALRRDLCNVAHCITRIGSRYNWGLESCPGDRMSFDVVRRAPKILALDSHARNWASKNSLDRSGKKKEHIAHQTNLLCLLTATVEITLRMIEIESTAYSALLLNTQEFISRLIIPILWKSSMQKLHNTWYRGRNIWTSCPSVATGE